LNVGTHPLSLVTTCENLSGHGWLPQLDLEAASQGQACACSFDPALFPAKAARLRTIDEMTLDRWVPFRREGAVVRCRLFSFPHAAGTAAYYRRLRNSMPAEFDLCPLELPGRGARLDEPPFISMSALMTRLSHVLQPLMDVPFGFLGHSVGACMAFEAARQLRSADGRAAVHLFVSGRGSPSCGPADPAAARLRSDHDLLAILARFGGTPAAILQRPELMAVLLPALRSDLALVEGYAVDPGDRIACPITAFGGADDVSHSGSLQSWSAFTRGTFRSSTFPGGHFYFSPEAQSLANEIIRDLCASLDICAAGARSRP
jgi:medium-chain acyl-[acyl-carrier-protein] hydrolase